MDDRVYEGKHCERNTRPAEEYKYGDCPRCVTTYTWLKYAYFLRSSVIILCEKACDFADQSQSRRVHLNVGFFSVSKGKSHGEKKLMYAIGG